MEISYRPRNSDPSKSRICLRFLVRELTVAPWEHPKWGAQERRGTADEP